MARHAAEERKSWAIGLVASFLLSSAFVSGFSPLADQPEPAAASVSVGTCSANGYTSGGVTIFPSHGKAFYIDTGQGQDINASYIGYRITASPSLENVSLELTDFTGGVISLANPAEKTRYLGEVTTSVKAAYFFLSAPKPTTVAQTHKVTVYSGTTPIAACVFSFERVRETIKAAANKLYDPFITVTSTDEIGGTLTITQKGNAGTVGAGSAPDYDTIWLSPATNINWPSSALQLVGVSAIYRDKKWPGGGATTITRTNDLILPNAKTAVGGDAVLSYEATYTFKILSRASASVRPAAQISSGTQMKHTDMTSIPTTTVNTQNATTRVRVTKSSSPAISVSGKIQIPFEITLANSGSSTVVLDTIEDVASISGQIVTSSIQFNGTAYDLAYSTSNVAAGTNTWVFTGPFSIPANSTRKLSYRMELSCVNGSFEFKNSATAKIGQTIVGSSTTQSQAVRVSVTSDAGCSVTSSSVIEQETLPIEVVTGPVQNLTVSPDVRVTISGTVDANDLVVSVTCQISQQSDMSSATSINARIPAGGNTAVSSNSQPVACDATGLLYDTVYYYRVRAGSTNGEILSFRTPPAPVASPTITTLQPSNVGRGSATLRGEVNPGGQLVRVEFVFFTVSSDVTCANPGASVAITQALFDEDTNTYSVLELAGNYPVTYEYSRSFTVGQAYCYQALVKWGTSFANSASGNARGFTVQNAVAPTAYTDDPTSVGDNTATLRGSVDRGDNNATASFCITSSPPASGATVITGCLSSSVSAIPSSITATGNTAVSRNHSGLLPSTTYYYQTVAHDGTIAAYGRIVQFNTHGVPTAETDTASSVTTNSAIISGYLTANGANTTAYFCYTTSSAVTGGLLNHCATSNRTNPSNTNAIVDSEGRTSRTANLTGLTPDTLYYFQIFGTNSYGSAYGTVKSFRTNEDGAVTVASYNPPVPTTVAATNVTTQSATLNGSVTAGSLSANLRFCYSLASNLSPCIATVTANPSSISSGAASTSVGVTGLSAGTTYYFALIAQDSSTSATASALSFSTATESSTSSSSATSSPTSSSTASTESPTSSGSTGGGSGTTTSSPTSSATASPPLCSAYLSQYSITGNPIIRWLMTMTQYVGNFLNSLTDSPVGNFVANTLFIQSPVLGETGFQALKTESVVNLLGSALPKKSPTIDPTTITLEPGTKEGEVNLETTDGQTLEVLSVQSNELDVTTQFSGSDFNNPLTWQALGYGPKCWKLEPFSDSDYFYTLPNPIQLPPGVAAGNWRYSNVIVKAGSLTARSDTYQTDTVFASPKPGDRVFADINANGIFDPGGRSGDKAISHVIVCITNLDSTAPTQSPAATTSPVTTKSPTTSPAVTTSPTTSPALTTSPTSSPVATTSPTSSQTASPVPATQSPRPIPTKSEIVLPADCVWPEPTKSPPIAPPEPTKSPEIKLLVDKPTTSGGVPITPEAPGWKPLPTPSPQQSIQYSSPAAPCLPNSQFGVAMLVTNGTDHLCYRVTNLYMTYLSYPSLFKAPPPAPVPSSSETVTKSPGGQLADTGSENIWLVPFALLLLLMGAGLIRLARRND